MVFNTFCCIIEQFIRLRLQLYDLLLSLRLEGEETLNKFRPKFGNQTNPNMQNSMLMFTLSTLDRKYHFLENLVQEIKIVSLSWNLIPRLIRICRIQRWCSFFLFQTENILSKEICSKKSKLLVYIYLYTYTYTHTHIYIYI